MKIQDVKLIWEAEFSQLVSETYGRPYRLQQQGDMLAQESMVRFSVPDGEIFEAPASFEQWVSRPVDVPPPGEVWDRPWKRDLWWEREFYPPLEAVANDLHARGLLPAADYVIHVWW